MKPAWYIVERNGAFWSWLNTLHWPYTMLHLSFVVFGALLSPVFYWDRTLAALGAFLLAMGGAAHFLDLLQGDPLRLRLPRYQLVLAAVVALTGALAIGLTYVVILELWWVLPLIALGAFLVPAYNLEWFSGLVHNDVGFALSWGAFPFAVAYLVNAESLSMILVNGMLATFLLSLLQRELSTPVRAIRRGKKEVPESVEELKAWAGRSFDRALTLLVVSVPAMVIAVLLRLSLF